MDEVKEHTEIIPELGEPIPSFDLKKIEAELAQGFREVEVPSFRGTSNFKVRIHVPSIGTDGECARIYAETYNELLLSDKKILTRDEMEEQLKSRGIWTQEHIDKVDAIEDRMIDLTREGQEMHYKKRINKKRLNELKTELKRAQDEKTRLLAKKQSLMSQTIEGLAEMASLEHKLYICTTDENNNRLWTTKEEFRKENHRGMLVKLLQEGIFFWSGLPSNILDLLPEDILLRGAPDLELSQDKEFGKLDSQQQ